MVSSVNLSIGNEKKNPAGRLMTISFANPVTFGTPKHKLNAALGLPEHNFRISRFGAQPRLRHQEPWLAAKTANATASISCCINKLAFGFF